MKSIVNLIAAAVLSIVSLGCEPSEPDFGQWRTENEGEYKKTVRAANALFATLAKTDQETAGQHVFDISYPLTHADQHLVGINKIEVPVSDYFHLMHKQQRLQFAQVTMMLWKKQLTSQDAIDLGKPEVWLVDAMGNRVGGGTGGSISVQE